MFSRFFKCKLKLENNDEMSVMTKEELMHRVISSHLEITDKSKPNWQFSEACSPFEIHWSFFLNLDVSLMQVKLNNNSYYCKNWLSNGFMRNQHLMELFSYCMLPFSNSNHLFALSLAMMSLGDLCCRFLDHFSSLKQVRASHWSGNGVIVSLDNSHCELAFKVGLGPRVIFSRDIRAKVHPCFRLILYCWIELSLQWQPCAIHACIMLCYFPNYIDKNFNAFVPW